MSDSPNIHSNSSQKKMEKITIRIFTVLQYKTFDLFYSRFFEPLEKQLFLL